MNESKQQEFEEQQKKIENCLTIHFFADIQSLESEKFGLEMEKLKNHFVYIKAIF